MAEDDEQRVRDALVGVVDRLLGGDVGGGSDPGARVGGGEGGDGVGGVVDEQERQVVLVEQEGADAGQFAARVEAAAADVGQGGADRVDADRGGGGAQGALGRSGRRGRFGQGDRLADLAGALLEVPASGDFADNADGAMGGEAQEPGVRRAGIVDFGVEIGRRLGVVAGGRDGWRGFGCQRRGSGDGRGGGRPR